MSLYLRTAPPNIKGTDNKKEKALAVFLSNPRSLPALIVIPDRLTPGKTAST